MTKLFIARHAEADGPIIESTKEPTLGSFGIAQAHELASLVKTELKGRHVQVESSLNMAAWMTAQTIADKPGIWCHNRGRDVRTGARWTINDEYPTPMDGVAEAARAAAEMNDDYYDTALLIVTHGSIIKALTDEFMRGQDVAPLGYGEMTSIVLPPCKI